MANNDITFVRPEQKAACALWTKIRDVCKGAEAIKSKGGEYLPLLDPGDRSAKAKQRNQDYRDRAVFYPITGNTKIGLLGMAYRKDPTMTAPEKLDYLKTNADGGGISIYQQSQQVLEDILETARHGLYVDYAKESDQAIILRYTPENIINWRTERINGRNQLVLVILREVIEEKDGYGFKESIQYRELALEEGKFICRVWRSKAESGGGAYSVDAEYRPKPKGKEFWDEIPFTFVGAQNNDETIDDPPLATLVEINLGHYRNSADYEDSVWFCGQVQPYMTGLDKDWRDHLEKKGVKVGSRNPLLLPQDGTYGYAQAQPNMLAKEAMDSKRDYMVQLGARLIEQNSATKTATQASGEQSAATSILSICVSNVSEAFSKALAWCAKYLGVTDVKADFSINQEFIARVADSGMVSVLVSAWQSGAIRDSDLVRVLQKLDIIDPADSVDEVIDALRNANPTLLDK
ncbi:DUF4055 domain-containing protein [Enterobacter chengduensis]|uniref:DUF4055 domain-containing protein n=1 Tax=Enterobacter TaxID=547 RepID=UPI00066724F2|nr:MULTISPECIES: DUF4055 domain-containing protein [Enterobacter]ELV3043807.1 DUF4055 domain-containing protein [Enterobacter chengduensis]MCK7280419.1 DUF4055 domain-containing protein [Enterobacter chengduensis]MDY0421594.1 DUF4055 domain-containing protein [Enterobacter sp. 170250]GFZ54017.1 hypothetical protein ENTKAS01_15410 [Enterobacter sp. AS-1]HDS5485159.1 DUF4055 domain-containing protein [Enterobacter chengduensis]